LVHLFAERKQEYVSIKLDSLSNNHNIETLAISIYFTYSSIIKKHLQLYFMTSDQTEEVERQARFAERIAKIRMRFCSKLTEKIMKTDAALPHMAGEGSDAVEAVASAYHCFHDVSGIGSTIGFPETGQKARSCEAVLVKPFRAQRGLSPDELALLTLRLESFRSAAQTETFSSP
jgi:hypothetical protein